MKKKFCLLVGEHENQAYSLAFYLLHDSAEAEDVVQESFVKLWHQLDTLKDDGIKPWLMRVVRNGSLDRLRKRKPAEELSTALLVADTREEPDSRLIRERVKKQLMQAINSLGEPWTSLLILRDIHEQSYEFVGAVLDLGPEQVKVYLHRARKKLAALWQDQNTV